MDRGEKAPDTSSVEYLSKHFENITPDSLSALSTEDIQKLQRLLNQQIKELEKKRDDDRDNPKMIIPVGRLEVGFFQRIEEDLVPLEWASGVCREVLEKRETPSSA